MLKSEYRVQPITNLHIMLIIPTRKVVADAMDSARKDLLRLTDMMQARLPRELRDMIYDGLRDNLREKEPNSMHYFETDSILKTPRHFLTDPDWVGNTTAAEINPVYWECNIIKIDYSSEDGLDGFGTVVSRYFKNDALDIAESPMSLVNQFIIRLAPRDPEFLAGLAKSWLDED